MILILPTPFFSVMIWLKKYVYLAHIIVTIQRKFVYLLRKTREHEIKEEEHYLAYDSELCKGENTGRSL